jgi:hypothetical protein
MRMLSRIALVLVAVTMACPLHAELQKAQDDRAVVAGSVRSVLIDVLANDGELGENLRVLKVFKPSHGSVSIESGRVRYTPFSGFDGSDSFRYMAQADKSQPGQATVSVEVGQGGVALRLVGQVVDDPIPGAIVKVSLGGFDFQTVADANGNYVLDIAALHGDAFVTLTATGTAPSGAAVRFYSVVGEMVRLASAAGSDGVLVRDEFNQVNVTNLSTAQYTLLAEANGGAPVGSDQQLLPLVQNIDLNELLKLAAVIKLVVDDGVALPAGTTDALALISDPAALTAFEASLAPDQLDLAIDAVSQDTNITPVFRAGAIPSGYAVLSPSAAGTIRVGIDTGGIATFTTNANGTSGTGTSLDPQGPGSFTWNLVDGDLLLQGDDSPSENVFNETATGPNCNSGQVFEVHETPQGVRVHRLQDGAGVDYLEIFHAAYRHYVDLNSADSCLPPSDGNVMTSERLLAFEDGSGELPFAIAESFGRIVLTHEQVPTDYFANAAIFNFDTHTVAIPGTDPNFTSSVSNGRLHVQLTNAAGVTDYEYRRYQVDGSKGEGLLAVVTLPDGSRRARYALASRVDGSLAFDVGNLPFNWRSGFDISQFPGDGTVDFGFFVHLNGDVGRTGIYESVDSVGAMFTNNPFTWGVESGQMVARSWRSPGFGATATCQSAGCWIRRIRTWQPIARDGNRIYVLEDLQDPINASGNVASDGVLKIVAQRVNFYEAQ